MRDPKIVYTASGLEEYKYHLQNLKRSLDYLQNQIDDLHLWEVNDIEVDTAIVNLQSFLESDEAMNGDGETDD